MDSGRHKLSENIWFVWSKMSYNGDMEGGVTLEHNGWMTECEDRARILETEFAKRNQKMSYLCNFICTTLQIQKLP